MPGIYSYEPYGQGIMPETTPSQISSGIMQGVQTGASLAQTRSNVQAQQTNLSIAKHRDRRQGISWQQQQEEIEAQNAAQKKTYGSKQGMYEAQLQQEKRKALVDKAQNIISLAQVNPDMALKLLNEDRELSGGDKFIHDKKNNLFISTQTGEAYIITKNNKIKKYITRRPTQEIGAINQEGQYQVVAPAQPEQPKQPKQPTYKDWYGMASKIMEQKMNVDAIPYKKNPNKYQEELLTLTDKLQNPEEREKLKTQTGVDVEQTPAETPGVLTRIWDAVFNPDKMYTQPEKDTPSIPNEFPTGSKFMGLTNQGEEKWLLPDGSKPLYRR